MWANLNFSHFQKLTEGDIWNFTCPKGSTSEKIMILWKKMNCFASLDRNQYYFSRLFCRAEEKDSSFKFWPFDFLVSLESLQNSLSFLMDEIGEKSNFIKLIWKNRLWSLIAEWGKCQLDRRLKAFFNLDWWNTKEPNCWIEDVQDSSWNHWISNSDFFTP